MSASVLNYIRKYFPRGPQAAAGPGLPTHQGQEGSSSWASSTTTLAQAPNDARSIPPRVALSAPTNPTRRGDIILSVLDPKAWIPIAIMLAVAGLTVALVRAFGRANDARKDH